MTDGADHGRVFLRRGIDKASKDLFEIAAVEPEALGRHPSTVGEFAGRYAGMILSTMALKISVL